MSRPRNPKWLSWTEARLTCHDEAIRSQVEYFRWWDRNQPGQIPKYPERVYQKEWKGWNDYLGNENTWGGAKKKLRPWLESLAFAHGLHLHGQTAWQRYVADVGLPDDVPSHPECYYKEWVSWGHWVGNTVSGRMAAKQEIIADAGMLYVVHMPGRPNNVFKIGCVLGMSELKELQVKDRFSIIKVFKMRVDFDWKAMALQYGKPWWENEKEWIMDNVHEFTFDLMGELDPALMGFVDR